MRVSSSISKSSTSSRKGDAIRSKDAKNDDKEGRRQNNALPDSPMFVLNDKRMAVKRKKRHCTT